MGQLKKKEEKVGRVNVGGFWGLSQTPGGYQGRKKAVTVSFQSNVPQTVEEFFKKREKGSANEKKNRWNLEKGGKKNLALRGEERN